MRLSKSFSLPPRYVEWTRDAPSGLSFDTNASPTHRSAGCNGFIVGKSAEAVVPVTWATPAMSTAMPEPTSLGPAQISPINHRASLGRDLHHECVVFAAELRLQRIHRGKITGFGVPGHVGGATGIDRDTMTLVKIGAAEIGGIDEPRAVRCELGNESFIASSIGSLERIHEGEVSGMS